METVKNYITENVGWYDLNEDKIVNFTADYSHIRVINLLERLKTTGVISEEMFLKHFENEIKLTNEYKK